MTSTELTTTGGTPSTLYPPGLYRIRITAHEAEDCDAIRLAFRPLGRITLANVRLLTPSGPDRGCEQVFQDAAASGPSWLRISLAAACLPLDAFGEATDDPHGLVGREAVAECEHRVVEGVLAERWTILSVRRDPAVQAFLTGGRRTTSRRHRN